MKNIYIIYIILSILFSCCRIDNSSKKQVSKDIPDSTIYYPILKKLVKELNLENMEMGVDSFELRIWYKNELFIGGDYLLLIKTRKYNTKGFIYRYWRKALELHSGANNITPEMFGTIDSFRVKNVVPKSGWKSFFERIKKEQLYELPSENNISGFKSRHTDGYTWFIEIATKDKYRFYYYGSPEIYAKEFKECAQMVNITKILKEEFNFPE